MERRRYRSCHRKVRYPTDHAALRAAKRLHQKGERVHVYSCRYCGGGWHVGH